MWRASRDRSQREVVERIAVGYQGSRTDRAETDGRPEELGDR